MSDTLSQQTLATNATFSGIGLHSGVPTTLRLLPAPPGTGIVFIRTDLPHRPLIPACAANAVDAGESMRRTILSKDGVEVQMVEHLMAALWGAGVDNAYVEVSGPELPGMDGSAGPFMSPLAAAGLTAQAAPRKYFSVREPVVVEEGGSVLAVFPDKGLSVSYTLSYPHPVLKSQFAQFVANGPQSFEQGIAPARTFCLSEEAEQLRARGLGKGATYENTLVVGPAGVLRNTLRFEDEFVRHKILDLLGDLYLLGATVRGRVVAIRSGHHLNARLLHKLSQAMEQWRMGALQAGTSEVMVGPTLDILQIQKILPHRYPLLLVDRIVELTETKAVGIKCVTMNEGFFQGHFPNKPIMPGVLMIEAMAQVGGIMILNKPEHKGKLAYFMSVDNVKFRRPVVPGDRLVISVELLKLRSRTCQMTGTVSVDGKPVCEGEFLFALGEE